MINGLIIEGSEIDFIHVRKVALVLRSINNSINQRILKLLEFNKELTVSEIYSRLSMDHSEVSVRLAKLRLTALVSARRKGKYIYYGLHKENLIKLSKILTIIVSK